MHVAGSGRVVIQLSREIGEGTVLCDSAGTRVARVMELIGPVSRPFASATPLTNNIKRHVGTNVFAAEPARDAPGGGGKKAAAAATTSTSRRSAPARTKKTRRKNR